ncbi:PAS domain-containing protein [Glacieibacterium megasporae]|uniref:PAS domain-containing protein n=1 Tax=Glacieibacterium megasporae TaxID=2835787 RepID=UPI001C1DF61A|nr:PAS domain-containing protein [Polymorphobacter megasporae]UAJ09975.1 PAS domain-containing protein [Polymorphobacter megasporae]
MRPDFGGTDDSTLASDFRALFGSADVGMVRFTTDTHRIIAANAKFCTIVGYAPGTLTGVTTDSLIDPTDTVTSSMFHAERIEDCSPNHEGRLLTKDGRIVWVRVASACVPDHDGVVRRSIALIRDLTGTRAAAVTAHDDRERNRLAMEAANAGAWELRLADRRLIWSREMFGLYDLPADTPTPTYDEWRARVHPDDLAAAEPSPATVGVATYSTDFRVRVEGGWRWLGARARLIRDVAGAPERVVGINFDLTESRVAAEAMSAAVARFSAAVDAMAGVLWTNSPEGEMIGEQRGWSALTGQAPDEYRGYGWAAAIHPDDAAATVDAWNVAVTARAPFVFEHRVRVADGSYRWFKVRALPVIADGTVREWVGVHTDIDDARTAGEALKANVAEAVTARERALAQLHEAQKLETIGQLTGGVAHDFNNLLTPIIGSLDLLSRRTPEPRAAKLIDGALTAAERAKTLVHRLLAFSRRQVLTSRSVDIVALIDGVRDLLARSLGPDIEIAITAGDDSFAEVDPAQLELAILNLAINGRDAMNGVGTLTIAVAPIRHADADYIRITVADTGSGMDEPTRRRAIEPFFTTKAVGRGTGLGLSMVHGLAAQSGGWLELDSAPGEGTRAHLWLPAARPADGEPAADEGGKERGTGQRILLVDDEPLVRSVTAAMLVDLGYEVVEADAAAEALHLVRNSISLVVTDYLMPGMNGAALAAALRLERPGLPVLIITGFAEGDTLDPTMPRLAKPFHQSDLAAAVAATMGKDAFARA